MILANLIARKNTPEARRWCVRCAAFGLTLGLLFSAVDAAVVFDWSMSESSNLLEVAWGATVSTAAYGALFLLLGLSGAAWMPRAQWLMVTITSGLTVGLVAAHFISVALKYWSGTFLTVEAVQFALNSWGHVCHLIVESYASELWLMLTVCLMAGVASALYMGRRLVRPGDASGKSSRVAPVVVATAAVVLPVWPAMALSEPPTAEMAMLSSLRFQLRGAPFDAADPTEYSTFVDRGAPLDTGRVWQAAAESLSPKGPNVLLVTLESVPARFLNDAAMRDVIPNLRALAANGQVLERVWSTATHSNYAQMAILSSLFPRRGRALDMYQSLDYPRVLLHDAFHALGYATATISSQDEDWQGMRRFERTGTPTTFWHSDNYIGTHVDIGSERVVPDDVTTKHALGWVDQQRAPWALYVNFQSTHFPYNLPPKAARPFQPDDPNPATYHYFGYPEKDRDKVLNRYKNALHFVDAQIGRLRRHLETRGILDDTLWVITADHGEAFRERGKLVTHGKTLYDLEARVPLILHWPKHLEPKRIERVTSHLDILPTVLDLVGVPSHPAFQGQSFAALARQGEEPEASELDPDDDSSEPAKTQRAVILNIQGLRHAEGIVCWPFKLIVEQPSGKRHLFQLDADPEERDDRLAHTTPDTEALAESLGRRLRAFIQAQMDYHDSSSRFREYAPRLPDCPELPPSDFR